MDRVAKDSERSSKRAEYAASLTVGMRCSCLCSGRGLGQAKEERVRREMKA